MGVKKQEKQVITNSLYRGCTRRRGLGERKSRGTDEDRMEFRVRRRTVTTMSMCVHRKHRNQTWDRQGWEKWDERRFNQSPEVNLVETPLVTFQYFVIPTYLYSHPSQSQSPSLHPTTSLSLSLSTTKSKVFIWSRGWLCDRHISLPEKPAISLRIKYVLESRCCTNVRRARETESESSSASLCYAQCDPMYVRMQPRACC